MLETSGGYGPFLAYARVSLPYSGTPRFPLVNIAFDIDGTISEHPQSFAAAVAPVM
jgi:hypothetical protein